MTKCDPGIAALEIQVGHKKSSDQSFESFVNSQVSTQGRGLNPGGKLEKLSINGKVAYKVERSGWDTACVGPGYFIEQQDDDSYTYIFTGSGNSTGTDTTEQIVNSLNFFN